MKTMLDQHTNTIFVFSLGCESPLDARVKSALLADTLTLVGIPAVPMCKPEISGQTNSLKMRIGAVSVHSFILNQNT